jgi:hypothetical protein
MPRRRRPSRAYDVVTPTERERRLDEVAAMRRRYLLIMVPCLVLVVFGFFVPAPVPLRVAALLIAAVLPPIAAIVGSRPPL